MKQRTLSELNEKYDLELDKVISDIKKSKAKLVLLQFPDGLKMYSTVIVDLLEEKTGCSFLVWFGSCFGACDTPNLGEVSKSVDLVVQFGHSSMMPNY